MEGLRVKLTEVNPYLVCVLCQGYLVDATTVAECLHSFCRSCIFRHLSRESVCPICKTQVHNTKLYKSLRPDKTLQDIVYKLVPGLFHNEMQRRREFYKSHPYRDEHLEPECRGVCLDRLIYSPKDQISLSLEIYNEEREKEEWSNNQTSPNPKPAQTTPSGPKRYLQCPAGFKMYHLKKFLRQKYGLSPACKIDILYRRECIPDSYSLMDIAYIYTWKRNSPMRFYFRMPEIIMKRLMAVNRDLPRLTNANSEKKDSVVDANEKSETEEPTSIENSNVSEENKKEQGNAEVKTIDSEGKEECVEKEKKNEREVDSRNNRKKADSMNGKKEAEAVNNKNEADLIINKKHDEMNNGEVVTKSPDSQDVTMKEESKTKIAEIPSPDKIRSLSKHDELPVSALLSLSQCRVDNSNEHKFIVPQALPPKNGIIDKKPNKISLKLPINKGATDLVEQKQQQNNENVRVNAQIPQQQPPQKQKPIVPKPAFYQKPKHIQPKQPHMTPHKQQMLLLKQHHQQQKQQQLQQQKQQIQQIIKQQQELQLQIEQQQQQLQLQQQQKYMQQQQKLQQQQQKYQIQQQQMQIQQMQHQQLRHQFPNQGIPLSPQQRSIAQQNQSPLIQHIIYDGQPIQVQQSLQQPHILQITQQQPQTIQINSQSGQFAQVSIPAQQNASAKIENRGEQNKSHNASNDKDQEQVPNNSSLQSKEKEVLVVNTALQQDLPKNTDLCGTTSQPSEKPATPPTVEKSGLPAPPLALSAKTPPLQCTPPPLMPTTPTLRTPPPLTTPPPQVQASSDGVTTSQPSTNKSPQSTCSVKQRKVQSEEMRSNSEGVEHVQTSIAHMSGGNVNYNHVTPDENNASGLKSDTKNNISQEQLKKLSPPPLILHQQTPPVTEGNSKSTPQVQSPQVTLNTSNGSVTIMAQLKQNQNISSPSSNSANSLGLVNGISPGSPRPQGVHQNLPRTVLPTSPFLNGKPTQKVVQQKNISGQRLNNNNNNNISDLKNGLIPQTNSNNRLPTFPKNGGSLRKSGPSSGGNKSGHTLEQRIQQLYKSGQTNKPPSPNGKSESRLANWLTNRFKAQSPKEESEPSTPTSPSTEVSMTRYKRKLPDLQNGQEVCEITQENPRPDDAKRRRDVTPDVSIELMRAADIKKLEVPGNKKEKRPVPGLKSIQEVSAKRKKEDESVLDLSSAPKPGDIIQPPPLPWVVNRPPHFIPRPT